MILLISNETARYVAHYLDYLSLLTLPQIGTVNYMSPEAIEIPDGMRRYKVGRASDIWSLGCILYQMVYGHPPFQHLTMYQKMKAIPDDSYAIEYPEYSTPSLPRVAGSSSPPKTLDHIKVKVSPTVIETIKSCLERNPKERATIPELLSRNWLALGASKSYSLSDACCHAERCS